LREELYPQGLEIVTVALDTLGLKVALPFIEAANPTHPSLIDEAHLLDELFGITNVPSGIWIDEQGVIVRPVEPAPLPLGAKSSRPDKSGAVAEETRAYVDEMRAEVKKMTEVSNIRKDYDKYVPALHDWVTKGADSRYALSPEEVLRRSRPRPAEEALGAAHFELGQHLYRQGKTELAIPHFREAHRLQPDNWTYRRQAWSMANPLQGPTDLYEGDWLKDTRKIGAENYYPPLDMD